MCIKFSLASIRIQRCLTATKFYGMCFLFHFLMYRKIETDLYPSTEELILEFPYKFERFLVFFFLCKAEIILFHVYLRLTEG